MKLGLWRNACTQVLTNDKYYFSFQDDVSFCCLKDARMEI